MRTITHRITSLLALAGGFLLSSCIEESTVIKVSRDGSGIIHERSYSGASDSIDIFPGLSGDKEGEKEPAEKETKLPSEDALREYAKTLGTGVTFTSVKASTNKKGWNGYEIVYNFEDINTVRYMRNTPKPDEADAAEAADPDKETDKKDDEFTATFAMKDGKLSITMVREGFQKPQSTPVQTPDSPTIDPYGDTTGPAPANISITPPMMNEEMVKAMTKGMRMGLFLQVNGEIAETNATHRNGNLITLFNADLGTLLENKGGMANLNKMEHFDRATFQEAADQLDGLDIDLQDPITVEFK